MNETTAPAAKTVRCPACAGPSLYAPGNRYRPFCSERCRHMDLGAWASEQFRMPEQVGDRTPGFESGN